MMMMMMGSSGGNQDVEDMGTRKPAWLQGLTEETFFEACGVHQNQRKNEKNIFCLICCQSFCPHCLPSHSSHAFLQVRRYVYQDVVRLDDLEKLIDCSFVQPYTINSAKVIFLNQRAQSKSCKGSTNSCFTCDRILQDPFHFCSLSCKVDHMVYQGENLSSILYRFDETDFACSQFEGLQMDSLDLNDVVVDDGQITPNSILEDPLRFTRSSYSSTNNTMDNSGILHVHEEETSTKKKKKRSGFIPAGIVFSLGNRRKGAPQRSPLS